MRTPSTFSARRRVRCLYPNQCKYHVGKRASGTILCSPKHSLTQKPIKPEPKVDLTTQGIEPNPGPPKAQRKRKVPNKDRILRVKPSQPAARKITGRGGYVTDIASKAGSWLGSKAGGWLEKLFGLGTYKVRKNTLWKPPSSSPNDPPTFTNVAGGTVVTHREYIQDITGTIDFTNQVFPINPGLSLTHPWMSNIATSFAQYRPLGIIFEYKSTATTAISTSVNQQAGVVIMATNYNVLEPQFSEKRVMENYTYVTSCSPYENAMHPVECDPVTLPVKELYVRSASVGDADLRFNDLGKFQLATVGMPVDGGKIGELWATYQYELIKPRMPTGSSSNLPDHYTYNASVYPTLSAPTAAALFGTSSAPGSKVVQRGVGSNILQFSSDPNTILFTSSGRFFVQLLIYGDDIPASIPAFNPPTFGTGVTSVAIFSDDTSYTSVMLVPNSGVTSPFVSYNVCVDVDLSAGQGPQGIKFNPTVLTTSTKNLDVFVLPLPPSFTARNPRVPLTLDEKINDLMAMVKGHTFVEDEKHFDGLLHVCTK